MLSYIDLGKGLGRWNTIPTLRRNAVTSVSGAKISSSPSKISPRYWQPSMVSFIRFIQRNNVDLPHPLGPMIAVTSAGGISRVTSLNAVPRGYDK